MGPKADPRRPHLSQEHLSEELRAQREKVREANLRAAWEQLPETMARRPCGAGSRSARDAPLPKAIEENRDLGFMLWDINHGTDRSSMFFKARLENGVVHIPVPESAEIHR